jgi:PST family polysaccharide transporter
VTGGLRGAGVGTLWLGATTILTRGSHMLVAVVLAMFLSPTDLGLVAVAVTLFNVGAVLQALGVYDVIARTAQDPHRMAATVMSLSVGFGLILALLGVLFAGPLATLLGEPAAAQMVRLAVAGLPLAAAAGVQNGLMHRDLDFRRRLIPEGGAVIVGGVVTVILAARGAGGYSLAIGILTICVVQPILGMLVGVRVRPGWDRETAAEALRWIRVVGPGALAAILVLNVGYLAVARALGPDDVGLYALAFRIASVPFLVLGIVLGAVAFPVYSRMIRDGNWNEMPTATARFTQAVVIAVGGVCVLIALLSGHIGVLGARWQPSAPVLAVLAGWALTFCLLHTWLVAVRAAGAPRAYLGLQIAQLVILSVLLAVLAPAGVIPAAVAYLLSAAVLLPAAWLVLRRVAAAPASGPTWRAVLHTALAAVLTWAVHVVLNRCGLLVRPNDLSDALVEAVLLATVYAGTIVAVDRDVRLMVRRLFAGAHR